MTTGEAWRDRGNCSNPPPPWAPAHGWRRRCEGGGGSGNSSGGSNSRGQNNNGDTLVICHVAQGESGDSTTDDHWPECLDQRTQPSRRFIGALLTLSTGILGSVKQSLTAAGQVWCQERLIFLI